MLAAPTIIVVLASDFAFGIGVGSLNSRKLAKTRLDSGSSVATGFTPVSYSERPTTSGLLP